MPAELGAAVSAEASVPAAFYVCRVAHRRRIAPHYRFVYRLFYVLWDVDQIDEALKPLRLFSRNRFNVLSFYDRDHGGRGAEPLRSWAERLLRDADIELHGGRIRLLALPRVFGFAFNPIALWYCDDASGRLRAVIAEVRNTFGERHCYLLASKIGIAPYQQTYETDKCFHVSPFFDLIGRYCFTLTEPDVRLRVAIHETRAGVPILDATLAGERRALRDPAIVRQVLAMPWMTLKVVLGIHWEALKIWLRGGRYHAKPAPPDREVT